MSNRQVSRASRMKEPGRLQREKDAKMDAFLLADRRIQEKEAKDDFLKQKKLQERLKLEALLAADDYVEPKLNDDNKKENL